MNVEPSGELWRIYCLFKSLGYIYSLLTIILLYSILGVWLLKPPPFLDRKIMDYTQNYYEKQIASLKNAINYVIHMHRSYVDSSWGDTEARCSVCYGELYPCPTVRELTK